MDYLFERSDEVKAQRERYLERRAQPSIVEDEPTYDEREWRRIRFKGRKREYKRAYNKMVRANNRRDPIAEAHEEVWDWEFAKRVFPE